jgi:cobalt-zinc-cadmium efflux system membrane fusion protein
MVRAEGGYDAPATTVTRTLRETMSQSPRPPRRTLPRQVQLFAVGAAALAALLAILAVWLTGLITAAGPQSAAARPAAPGTFRPTKAEWAGLKLGTVKLMTFYPEVEAEGRIAIDQDHTTPVYSSFSGRVVKVVAEPGEVIAQGAPLLEVDSSELVQGTDKFIAALSQRETALAKLKLAEISEKREHALYLAKGTALKTWQKSEADLAAARDRLRIAEIAVASAPQDLRILGIPPQEIATIERAPPQDADPFAWVRAPISGTVIARKVGPGQYLPSGSSHAVFTIGDLSTVWLVAQVRESDAPLVRVGQQVQVRVLAYPGRTFDAKISWIASSIDPKTHCLPVRADVRNPGNALKSGMFARFRIITGLAGKTPAVPREAIILRGSSERVWLLKPDGVLAARAIRTGGVRDGRAEVLSGLKAGDRVVTSGSLFIDSAASGG